MAEMTTFIQEVALTLGVKSDGYRLITNIGQNGNQEVKHIHFHLLAGEQLGRVSLMQVFGKFKEVHDLEYLVKSYLYIPLKDENNEDIEIDDRTIKYFTKKEK